MPYLLRPISKPRLEGLSPADRKLIEPHFSADSIELTIDGQPLEYSRIDTIEVARAARQSSPAGWIVKHIVYGGEERFHVGIYYGQHELVLPNLTKDTVMYVTGTIAFYARNRITYTGPDGLIPVGE